MIKILNDYRVLIAASLITALVAYGLVPPPHQSRAQFVQTQTFAGTATGSANVVTLSLLNWTANLSGVPIQFIPASDNTAATTVNVNSVGAGNALRSSSIGLTAFSGHEFRAGVLTTIVWDGTQWQLLGPINPSPIGSIIELRGSAAPPGYLIEDGSCVSQTTYPGLFSVIATTYGSCSAGLFALPDSRGTMFAALDNQGVNGSAGRITSGGSGCTATSIGQCGAQSQTLTSSQIPTINSANPSQIGLSVGTAALPQSWVQTTVGTGLQTISGAPGAQSVVAPTGLSSQFLTAVGNIPVNAASVVSNNTSGNAHPILNPILLGTRAIKY